MEESIKNKVMVGLAVLCAILFIASINSCGAAYRNRLSREKEMRTRLDAEEQLAKEKGMVEDKIKGTLKELEEEKAAHQATKKALVQEQLVNQSLKEELTKVTKLKEALEEDLKEALVSGKVKSKK